MQIGCHCAAIDALQRCPSALGRETWILSPSHRARWSMTQRCLDRQPLARSPTVYTASTSAFSEFCRLSLPVSASLSSRNSLIHARKISQALPLYLTPGREPRTQGEQMDIPLSSPSFHQGGETEVSLKTTAHSNRMLHMGNIYVFKYQAEE